MTGALHREVDEHNQDAYAVDVKAGAFAIADGHGPAGHITAQTAVDTLVANAHSGIREAFAAASAAVDALPGAANSGATATLAVSSNGKLLLGNVGDSDAVLGACALITNCHDTRQEAPSQMSTGRCDCCCCPKARVVTAQHRPDRLSERQRIESAGGTVEDGYVVDNPQRPERMINVTRAFGDRDVRNLGIIQEPDCVAIDLSETETCPNAFLIMATDGLWDAHGGELTPQRAADVIRQQGLYEGCYYLLDLAAGSSSHPLDDCTILVIPLSSFLPSKSAQNT